MNRTRRILILAACLLLALMAVVPTALAAPGDLLKPDVGNFNDYNGGGSSGDWGGSSSSGFGNLMGMAFLFGDGPVFWIVLVVIVVGVILSKRGGHSRGTAAPRAGAPTGAPPVVPDHTEEIVAAVTQIDPLFSKEKFLAWSKEVFVTLQQAWNDRDWSRIRPFEKEELYRQHELQLRDYINKGQINVIERVNVNQAYLHQYERDAEYEYLKVYMRVRMVDYIIDERTKKVLRGDPSVDCHLQYLLTFMRKKGVLTDPAVSNNSVLACPHCGAPVQVTSAGKCEYCGYMVTTGECDWVLSDMEGVKPGFSVDNRGVVLRDQ